MHLRSRTVCCFFMYTATTESYPYGHTLSLHVALPISPDPAAPTTIPLPGTQIPPIPTRTPVMPQLPIGPHGRPDINPYDRDIEMTVPLTFQSSSLGDIPMLLTADDRFLIESATFLRLMQPVLN